MLPPASRAEPPDAAAAGPEWCDAAAAVTLLEALVLVVPVPEPLARGPPAAATAAAPKDGRGGVRWRSLLVSVLLRLDLAAGLDALITSCCCCFWCLVDGGGGVGGRGK